MALSAPRRLFPWQDYLALAFRLSAWVLGTVLAIVGVFVVGMFVFSDLTLNGFFQQTAALSTHFLSAPPEGQQRFEHSVEVVGTPIVLLVLWFRRAGLRAIILDLVEAHYGRR